MCIRKNEWHNDTLKKSVEKLILFNDCLLKSILRLFFLTLKVNILGRIKMTLYGEIRRVSNDPQLS